MAKKQAQFRFEESFYKDIQMLAEIEGQSLTEIVKNSLNLYATLYNRTKGKRIRFYLENLDDNSQCEVILPWLPYKHQ